MGRVMEQAIITKGLRMVRAMERRQIAKHHEQTGSRKLLFFLLLTVLCGGLLLMSVKQTLAQDQALVLPESGIHYPGGFDANTVGVLQGKIYGISLPPSGPVQFRLVSKRENYIVVASPPWFWKDLDLKISEGAEVVVRGSKSMGKDGKLYVIGQEMEVLSTGKVYVFRDEDGYPLWKGVRTGTRGSAGFGSPQKRNGGFGEAGRGRR